MHTGLVGGTTAALVVLGVAVSANDVQAAKQLTMATSWGGGPHLVTALRFWVMSTVSTASALPPRSFRCGFA